MQARIIRQNSRWETQNY